MKTVIPAQPGFFAVYPSGRVDPIIAWEITYHNDLACYTTWPITPAGEVGDDCKIKYRTESGSTITVGVRG
jgi:hypothetical protein